MFDFIKPNKAWEEISNHYDGTIIKGDPFRPVYMQIYYHDFLYDIRTKYTWSNTWQGKTIIECKFLFNKKFRLQISKSWYTKKKQSRVKVFYPNQKMKMLFSDLPSLERLSEFFTSYRIDFLLNEVISESYEMLPVLRFSTYGYIESQKTFDIVFKVMKDLSEILLEKEIVRTIEY